MNFLVVAISFLLGGATVISLGIRGVQSFFDEIRAFLDMLFG